MTKTSWQQLKQIINQNSLAYTWVQDDNSYTVTAFNGPAEFKAIVPTSFPANLDQADFENNYKAFGNQPISVQVQPFSSKILPNGDTLFERFTGISQLLSVGSNVFTWTQSNYQLVKILGIEAIGAELGDNCSITILDTAQGTYSGTPNAPLLQVAYSANIAPGFYSHSSSYDANIYQGLQIQFTYYSISPKNIYINLDLHEVATPTNSASQK